LLVHPAYRPSAKYPTTLTTSSPNGSAPSTPSRETFFRWRGRVIDEWTTLEPGTSLALCEDPQLSALKALMLARVGDPATTRLDFLPFADGACEAHLGSGNDFRAHGSGDLRGLHGAEGCTFDR
jgi:hypothetical protein